MTDASRDRYWLTRHYLSAMTLLAMVAVALAPSSLYGRALDASGAVGWVVLALLAVVSLLTLIEAFVTAFLPRMSCEWLRNRRHILFMVMAVGQLCLAYPVATYSLTGATLLIVTFSLNATVAATVAFLDLFARHKAERPA